MRIRNALDRIEKGCAFAFKADIFSKALGVGTLAFVRLHDIDLTCYIDENSHREIRNVYFTRACHSKNSALYYLHDVTNWESDSERLRLSSPEHDPSCMSGDKLTIQLGDPNSHASPL